MLKIGLVDQRTALVLYGSETGTAQDLAEEIGRSCERLRFTVKVAELNQVGVGELLRYSVVLFAISTTGQGDLPGNAQLFWKRLRSLRLQPGCLSRLAFASFGLGDSSYPQYNWAHRKLYNRLIQLGADPICDRGESDEQHPEGVDGLFLPWLNKLQSRLLEVYRLPEGIETIPDDVFLEPKWSLTIDEDAPCPPTKSSKTSSGQPTDRPPGDLLYAPGAVEAVLKENARVTPQDHWQDVRFLDFRIPTAAYEPGDVLTIYPKNFPDDVDGLIETMGWQDIADRTLEFKATQKLPRETTYYPPAPFNFPKEYNITLRRLLIDHLDVTAIPRRSFFAAISHFTNDEMQRDRLVEFTQPELVDELYDYTTRPRRSIIEVLQEFDTVKLPWKWVASIFPPLHGRQFSIASGGLLKQTGRSVETRVQLLVAVVKYKTVIKKIRRGVCTRYLSSLPVDAPLSVSLIKGGMKATLDRPCVLVGPGTGVAPLRSIIYERLMRNSTENGLSDCALFFGCRNESADFFFEAEWKHLASRHGLKVFTAFSRDQGQKFYVQDLIRQQSSLVFELLKTGNLYLCGSSGKMPQAVREALIEVFEKEAAEDRAAAEAHLEILEKSGRYQQETW